MFQQCLQPLEPQRALGAETMVFSTLLKVVTIVIVTTKLP